jgi:hypothetical protein
MGNSSSTSETIPPALPMPAPAGAASPAAPAPELAPNEPKPKCPMCVCKDLRAERDQCMLNHEDGKTVSR